MKCPKCQFENPAKAVFCMKCGGRLAGSTEPSPQNLSFDEKIDKIQRYLPEGLTEKVLAQRGKIEGERKWVTVMFCDIESFSPLVEKLGPEEAYSVMDQIYEILIHKVHDYGGTVNEMTGDGVMALFGAPISMEDAPQRALRSALSIHTEIAKFNDQKRIAEPIRMRIGINTGPVVVGTLGNDLRVEFKAVGDTVNLASRMEGLAEPGAAYVTEATFELTKTLFEFETLGYKALKVIDDPLPVFKLISAKEGVYRPRLGSERMIYSEMVGRHKELDILESQIKKVINGEGSIVSIIGEAGIGKSRLISELKALDIAKDVTFNEMRAISIGRNLNFHPIIDLLKRWARITRDDTDPIAFEKLETSVRDICSTEVDEIFPFLAILMGFRLFAKHAEKVKGIQGEILESRIINSVRTILNRVADLTPLVIIAEDLHWADTTTIEFFESLFSLAASRRILFINVFRPGNEETSERVVRVLRTNFSQYYTEIILEPLNAKMSELLVKNMLCIKTLHHSLIDEIVKRSDGNPFFIEEVTRSLIDDGAVIFRDGMGEITNRMDTLTIPYTVNDVLMHRIDRLDEETRDLLKVAAVIGRTFFYRVLAEVKTNDDALEEKLSYLKEIQLIQERERVGEIEFLFKHALAQEAVYESILTQKRKEIHQKVASAIEKLFRNRLYEFYGLLAFHYTRAENEKKSDLYLIKAGEEALKSSASTEALFYYKRALNLYVKKNRSSADASKINMLEINIALALYNKGKYVEAVEYLDRILSYYGESLPQKHIAIFLKLSLCFFDFLISLYLPFLKWKKISDQRDIIILDLFYKKLEMLSALNPKKMMIECTYFLRRLSKYDLSEFEHGVGMLAAHAIRFSWPGISFTLSRKILDYCRTKLKREDIKSVLYYEAAELVHNYFVGDWQKINRYDEDLVNSSVDLGEVFFASVYVVFHGYLNCNVGDLTASEKMVEKLSEIVSIYENDYSKSNRNYLKIKILLKFRCLEDAAKELERSLDQALSSNMNRYVNAFYAFSARIQILLCDFEAADDSLRCASKFVSDVKTIPYYYANFTLCQFLFYLSRFENAKMRGNSLESKNLANEVYDLGKLNLKIAKKVACMRTEAYRLMGSFHWLMNDQKKSLVWWNKSIAEGQLIDSRPELSRTYMEIGKRFLEEKSRYGELNGITAKEYLEKARTMFEEMDLQWDLVELDKITAAA